MEAPHRYCSSSTSRTGPSYVCELLVSWCEMKKNKKQSCAPLAGLAKAFTPLWSCWRPLPWQWSWSRRSLKRWRWTLESALVEPTATTAGARPRATTAPGRDVTSRGRTREKQPTAAQTATTNAKQTNRQVSVSMEINQTHTHTRTHATVRRPRRRSNNGPGEGETSQSSFADTSQVAGNPCAEKYAAVIRYGMQRRRSAHALHCVPTH